MGWTTPRTWTTSEVVTPTMMNAHLRDNQLVLKTVRNSAGRLSELSSTTLADLSAANVTGLARVASGNTFTGTSTFGGTSSVVLPVGADKYEDLGGGLRRGFWVEGDYLHHIASNQTTEWRYLGTYVSTPAGAVAGSVWVEGDDVHYIDASGLERRCSPTSSGHSDAAAIGGSTWVETYVHWIRESGSLEKPGHADVAHADGTDHYDTHDDVAHGDGHSDVGHADSHADVAHEDTHADSHTDVHEDHSDGMDYSDGHADIPGEDSHADEAHSDTHSDIDHEDSHSDAHTDTYSDHSDHGDVLAQSQPTVVS